MNIALPNSRPDIEVANLEDTLSGLCKAAADSLRLRILRLLKHDAMGVGELCDVLDVRQPALSHHLKLMSTAGLLSSQRDGNHIFYRRREIAQHESYAALRQTLFAAVDALPLDAAVDARRQALQRQREENSRDFFRSNAQRFREQQDLIAAPELYAPAVQTLLEALPAGSRSLALEVGPGEGWLLPTLSRLFDGVVALDNAPAMLETAERAAARESLSNVRFVLGDTSHAALQNIEADLVVMNMVLHHTPDPQSTLREAVATLKTGGSLLLTELCEHRQGWARENCGDLWLGFAPERITRWANDVGLTERSSSYLGQRNGFKLQLRLFGAENNQQAVKDIT